jgi:membrane associated rhomboid family serine protease
MAGAPDLFVVCKNCGSEVSPYITECPYCGNRLRKRAPKIERDASGESRPKERRKAPKPSLGRMRPGEMPGIRADADQRPYVTIALVVLGAIGFLVLAFVGRGDIALVGPPGDQLWRIFTTPFVHIGTWGQFACLMTIAIFGTLLERRHGSVLVLVLWLVAASGGAAIVAGLDSFPVVLGANAGALAFLAAWAVPLVLARRARPYEDDDADLLGTLVIAIVVAALPIAFGYSALAGAWGLLVGALAGLVLARTKPR